MDLFALLQKDETSFEEVKGVLICVENRVGIGSTKMYSCQLLISYTDD